MTVSASQIDSKANLAADVQHDGNHNHKYSHPGAKQPLRPDHVAAIRAAFDRRPQKLRDRALFETALSTCLRASDLVRLTVRDVTTPTGEVRDRMTVRQTKTAKGVTVPLSENARAALAALISRDGIRGETALFRREDTREPSLEAITTKTLRKLAKTWGADWAGLDARDVSAHSLRKTLPSAMYAASKDIARVQRLLGHSSPANTEKYLGITQADAVEAALAFNL